MDFPEGTGPHTIEMAEGHRPLKLRVRPGCYDYLSPTLEPSSCVRCRSSTSRRQVD